MPSLDDIQECINKSAQAILGCFKQVRGDHVTVWVLPNYSININSLVVFCLVSLEASASLVFQPPRYPSVSLVMTLPLECSPLSYRTKFLRCVGCTCHHSLPTVSAIGKKNSDRSTTGMRPTPRRVPGRSQQSTVVRGKRCEPSSSVLPKTSKSFAWRFFSQGASRCVLHLGITRDVGILIFHGLACSK